MTLPAACMMLFSNNSYAQSLGASLEDWLEVQGFESIEAYLNATAGSIMNEVRYVVTKNTGVTVKAVDVCVDSMTL